MDLEDAFVARRVSAMGAVDLEDAFVALARRVRRGEWTTYGDISAAATGSIRLARAVGRVAATLDAFPNAHRVLAAGGRVTRGRGSEAAAAAARALLQSEGVTFARERADPARRVHWDELARRLDDTNLGDASIRHHQTRHLGAADGDRGRPKAREDEGG